MEGILNSQQQCSVPPPSDLQPLDFTYILYNPLYSHSLILAYLTFTPIVLVIILFTAVILRRDLEAIYQLVGMLCSTTLNFLLKRLIKQARPVGSFKQGHGMPSDHAQFMCFCLLYLSVWMTYRVHIPKLYKRIFMTCSFIFTVLICWSRIHLGVHSEAQVCAGCIVGVVFGLVWAGLGRALVWKHVYPWLENTSFARFFYLKDTGFIQNLAAFEYEMVQVKRKQHSHFAMTGNMHFPKSPTKSNPSSPKITQPHTPSNAADDKQE